MSVVFPNEFSLDRESAIPLYCQLAAAMCERIQAGMLAAGDQLPN